MRTYDDLDEQMELFNRAMLIAWPMDIDILALHEEYCRTVQDDMSEEDLRNAENNDLAYQWYEQDEQFSGWDFDW
jgi:hypothetical protein